MKNKITVSDRMQKKYVYYITKLEGKNFHAGFKPELSPKEMLRLGVFGGKYMTDFKKEFPASWFKGIKLSPKFHDPALNYFKVNASKPLSYWKEKGWLYKEDPRGWFQWYCRYYRGRRSVDDDRQIKRWKAFTRHIAQLKKHCDRGDFTCRPVQRQALLNWSYDSRKL